MEDVTLKLYTEETSPVERVSMREVLTSYAARWVVYGGIALGTFQTIYLATTQMGAARVGGENGPIEISQVAFAACGAVGLFLAARNTMRGRAMILVCAAAVTYAIARECDLWFETLLFDDAYKYLVGLPMGIMVMSILWRDRRDLIGDFLYMMREPAATLFGVAGLHLCVACQMLDRPLLWSGLEGAVDIKSTQAMVEESMELFAYMLIAFSGVEAYLFANEKSAAAKNAAADNECLDNDEVRGQHSPRPKARIAA